jgi:CHASE3 domain sensor protein
VTKMTMRLFQELQAKNEAANAKLRQMVKDQQEAEKKKVQSQEIQLQLSEQTIHIEQKRQEVMADLAQVEPAVIDAQNGNDGFFVASSVDYYRSLDYCQPLSL